jgi:hypothetical protein
VKEDIHDISCSVGGFEDTEELPAYNSGDDRILDVDVLREPEPFRLVDSRLRRKSLKST